MCYMNWGMILIYRKVQFFVSLIWLEKGVWYATFCQNDYHTYSGFVIFHTPFCIGGGFCRNMPLLRRKRAGQPAVPAWRTRFRYTVPAWRTQFRYTVPACSWPATWDWRVQKYSTFMGSHIPSKTMSWLGTELHQLALYLALSYEMSSKSSDEHCIIGQ